MIKLINITCFIIFYTSFIATAEVLWQPSLSTYGGVSFTSTGSGKGRTSSSTAFGNGVTENSEYKFFLANTSIDSLPTYSQTELSSTEVPRGATLVLNFTKNQDDKINFITLTADASENFKFELLSNTSFRITAVVSKLASSPNGSVREAFGFILNLSAEENLNFGNTIFVTDINYLDFTTLDSITTGTIGIKGIAINGGLGSVTAFIPINYLSVLGINDSNQLMGFVDEDQVTGSDFKNMGVLDNLGFNFNDTNNPSNSLVKASIDNYAWNAEKKILFGTLADDEKPTLRVRGKIKITTKKRKVSISGTANDNFEVAKVQYFTKRRRRDLKDAALANNFWSFDLKRLRKGKRTIVKIFATDTSGIESKIKRVRVRRR